jgi:hypothetical protein
MKPIRRGARYAATLWENAAWRVWSRVSALFLCSKSEQRAKQLVPPLTQESHEQMRTYSLMWVGVELRSEALSGGYSSEWEVKSTLDRPRRYSEISAKALSDRRSNS